MKFLAKNALVVALLGGVFALGCSSTSNGDDGGGLGGAGGSDTDAAVTPFAITSGQSCFDIVSIQPGSDDATTGCMIGVADLVGSTAILVNYDSQTGILTVGTSGALGAGSISFNQGTLTRDSTATDPTMTTCSWHQTDTSNVNVTATNEFDLAVTETEDTFASACSMKPTGGTCTSNWTWHMKQGTKTPPGCD